MFNCVAMTLTCNAYHYVQLFLILDVFISVLVSVTLCIWLVVLCISLYVSCLSSVMFYCYFYGPCVWNKRWWWWWQSQLVHYKCNTEFHCSYLIQTSSVVAMAGHRIATEICHVQLSSIIFASSIKEDRNIAITKWHVSFFNLTTANCLQVKTIKTFKLFKCNVQ